ncbi:MAG: hypothetical protein OSJ65_02430 [Bacilli bacterium]|nr:hypothetical protein [Bacilli bacterium]
MKKFFEKHDLFKLTGIFVLIAVLLTWLVSSSYFTAGTLSSNGFNRVGLFDLTTYGLLQIFYFTVVFMFVLVVGGFYKFVGSLEAYDNLTSKIAAKFEGKEKVLVAISILLFGAATGVSTDYLVLFAIIPFVISILAKLKVDKVTGLVATFGGILVGILGATYAPKITGILADSTNGLGVSYGFELASTIVLFAVAYLLLTYFVLARMNKVASDNKSEAALLVDPFIIAKVEEKEDKKKGKKDKKKRKISSVGLAIVLSLVFVVLLLAYIGWEAAFNIKVFADVTKWIQEATLFGENVYSYILGSSLVAFGEWDLLAGAGLLLFASLVIKFVYHIPFDKMLDEYLEGFKVIIKPLAILMMVYLVLEISIIFPTISYLADKIMGLGNNIGTLFASGALTSLFAVDFQYTVSTVGSVFLTFSNTNVAALILQAAYGLIQFIAPTSAILMLGLACLDIKFKDYFKFIWKFALAMLIVIFVVLAILMYV